MTAALITFVIGLYLGFAVAVIIIGMLRSGSR